MTPQLGAVIALLGLALCSWQLINGLRTGVMRAIAHFSPVADRGLQPKLFWFLAGFNVFLIAAMLFVIVVAGGSV